RSLTAVRESTHAWARRRRASWWQRRGSSTFAACRSRICFLRSTKSACSCSRSLKAPLEGILQSRQDGVPIGDQPYIRALEDQRVGIVVDRDDRIRALETAGMVGCATQSKSNIQARIDRFAG